MKFVVNVTVTEVHHKLLVQPVSTIVFVVFKPILCQTKVLYFSSVSIPHMFGLTRFVNAKWLQYDLWFFFFAPSGGLPVGRPMAMAISLSDHSRSKSFDEKQLESSLIYLLFYEMLGCAQCALCNACTCGMQYSAHFFLIYRSWQYIALPLYFVATHLDASPRRGNAPKGNLDASGEVTRWGEVVRYKVTTTSLLVSLSHLQWAKIMLQCCLCWRHCEVKSNLQMCPPGWA